MPLFVTDDDVLGQIALDDAAAASIQGQITAMGASVPASTAAAWASDLGFYRAWAGPAKVRLSGGFFAGEWNGVVADGNSAIAWRDRFTTYQSILGAIVAGHPPAVLVPPPSSVSDVSDANTSGMVQGATGAIGSVASSVEGPLKWIAIAAVAGVVAFLMIERGK